MTLRPETPGYSDKLKSAKKSRGKGETSWRRIENNTPFDELGLKHSCLMKTDIAIRET